MRRLAGDPAQPTAGTSRADHYQSNSSNNFSCKSKKCDFCMQGMNIEIDDDDEVTLNACCTWISQRYFTADKLKRRLPFLNYALNYNLDWFRCDLIAGFTVAFTILPQALAFALLAGLPPKIGLFSSFIGAFVYALLGTCPQAAIGPTSILSVLIVPIVQNGGIVYTALLTFYTGALLTILGLLNFGFVLDFVSFPVISAFGSAAAITILASQLRGFFGVNYASNNFPTHLIGFVQNLHEIQWADTLLACASLFVLIVFKLMAQFQLSIRKSHSNVNRKFRQMFNGGWFFVASARNALVVLLSIFLVAYYPDTFQMTGAVQTGMPTWKVPSFRLCSSYQQQSVSVPHHLDPSSSMILSSAIEDVTWSAADSTQSSIDLPSTTVSAVHNALPVPNATITKVSPDADKNACMSWTAVLSQLSSSVLVLVLVALLEATAVVRSFGEGRKMDSTQEMLALGISNLIGSFIGSMPVTASFSRSAVNKSVGVKTTFSGIVCSSIVLFSIWKLQFLFEHVPQASLSAVIIVAIFPMVRTDEFKLIWRANRIDLLPYCLTMLICLGSDLQLGVLIGVLFSLSLLLYQMARPKVSIVSRLTPNQTRFLYVKPDRSVFFPSVEYVKVKIHQALTSGPENLAKTNKSINGSTSYSNRPEDNYSTSINIPSYRCKSTFVEPLLAVVIDGEHMFRADATFAASLRNLVTELKAKRLLTIFYNMHKSTHRALCTMLGQDEFICCHSEGQVYEVIHSNRLDLPAPVARPEANGHNNGKLLSAHNNYGSLDSKSDHVSKSTRTGNTPIETEVIINHLPPETNAQPQSRHHNNGVHDTVQR